MGEHTPGPFVIEDLSLGDKAIVDITANHASIGEAYSKDAISGKALPAHANATLWAAAPGLLAALCRNMLLLIIVGNLYPYLEDMDVWQTTTAANEAAIAKAKKGNET